MLTGRDDQEMERHFQGHPVTIRLSPTADLFRAPWLKSRKRRSSSLAVFLSDHESRGSMGGNSAAITVEARIGLT